MNNVGIFLFNDMELLDFAGPYEVFSVTAELNDYKLFKVFTVSEGGAAVKSVNGLTVLPDYGFDSHPPVDILVVPGGVGTRAEIAKPAVLEWVAATNRNAIITMSVCSGARVLGVLGLLDRLEATTHHQVIGHLAELAPRAIIRADERFVDNGKIMTAGGISAGIDLSFHIVTKLYGKDIADKTVRYMEYGDWRSR
ncbi:DJ-1/PfpI family protein [Anaeroselena agilis]|uniref:DJ-1/PfpI family protein n=1 Tax=Anaeroselena agilis TaxID=3063788 RepID=A0ABU3NV28_9FIRM|nr:DJ-1/PfpI family protein [Selenomonadales bacterium 4137-cl]